MITETQLSELAEKAGFGANQRNTYRVKLMLFARYVWELAMTQQKGDGNGLPDRQ